MDNKDENRIVVSPEDFEKFLKALDAPPKPNEKLKKLLTTPGVFDEKTD